MFYRSSPVEALPIPSYAQIMAKINGKEDTVYDPSQGSLNKGYGK